MAVEIIALTVIINGQKTDTMRTLIPALNVINCESVLHLLPEIYQGFILFMNIFLKYLLVKQNKKIQEVSSWVFYFTVNIFYSWCENDR